MNQYDDSHHHHEEPDVPGGISWFFQQVGWYLRKLILWPIADSFRWFGRGIARFFGAFRYRSPLAYIGATLAVTVTAGAIAAAVYFHDQSNRDADMARQIASQPVPVPAPTTDDAAAPRPGVTTTPTDTPAKDPALKGVAPNFSPTAATRKNTKAEAKKKPKVLIKPSPAPKAGPLRVAHRFSSTFVKYEVGDRKAGNRLGTSALPGLARELRKNPPRLPANGKVPEAAVLNVVKGKRNGKRMTVSVALLRTGATSELRLALKSTPDGWKVSAVRG